MGTLSRVNGASACAERRAGAAFLAGSGRVLTVRLGPERDERETYDDTEQDGSSDDAERDTGALVGRDGAGPALRLYSPGLAARGHGAASGVEGPPQLGR